MHMRDANARQLRLNQIDLNVNAEMQLGKGGFWLNNSEGLTVYLNGCISVFNTLFVWSSDYGSDLTLVTCN